LSAEPFDFTRKRSRSLSPGVKAPNRCTPPICEGSGVASPFRWDHTAASCGAVSVMPGSNSQARVFPDLFLHLHLLAFSQVSGQLEDTGLTLRHDRRTSLLIVPHADDLVETLAWEWLLANSEAHTAIVRMGGLVIRYEDLANDPPSQLHSLFSKLSLDWSDSTSQFLETSSAKDGAYYSLARNPVAAANRWKREMEEAQVQKIKSIVSRAPIGQEYFSQ